LIYRRRVVTTTTTTANFHPELEMGLKERATDAGKTTTFLVF
jgi:hypothetical protein